MLSTMLKNRNSLQLTLAILKPHVVKATHALKGIQRIIVENNFQIVESCAVKISHQQVAQFYEEHKNKFFYNRLITSMMSGDCEVYILAKANAIAEWRQLMGPTKVYQAIFTHPDSIRGMYGLTDTRNATHGSDSMESAAREISIFFPDFNTSQWLQENEESVDKETIEMNCRTKTMDELKEAVIIWLKSFAADEYNIGIEKLIQHYNKCLDNNGDYIESRIRYCGCVNKVWC